MTKQIKMFFGENVEADVNQWLQDNPNIRVIDVKLSSTAVAVDHLYGGITPQWWQDVMIIYEMEVQA